MDQMARLEIFLLFVDTATFVSSQCVCYG